MRARLFLLLTAATLAGTASAWADTAKADVGAVLVDGFKRYCAAERGKSP